MLNKFVGPYFDPLCKRNDELLMTRVIRDVNVHLCTCCTFPCVDGSDVSGSISSTQTRVESASIMTNTDRTESNEKEYLLRDLLLWAIFMDLPDMAKVLLFNISSRICGALIASAVFKAYSKQAQSIDLQEKYKSQSSDFETYAAECINQAYLANQRKACELLLRQVPLFGNVTCMQVTR